MTPRQLMEPARHAGAALLRSQSDERLVDLVRHGNDRAFEAIVHRYRRPLLRYCGRFLTQARAEDAVQLAFVNAIAGLRSSDSEIRLRPWLYRIAHNAALNVLREAGADHDEVSERIDGVETPPQALERGERLRAVLAAVQHLPERQRDAIVLQALEGRSYDQIAAELGVTGGAVRQLLNRARTTLRDAATALTPPAVLVRLGGTVEHPVAERVAQAVAGAGGGAALAKVTAIVVAGAAAVGGTVEGLLPGDERRSRSEARASGAPAEDRARAQARRPRVAPAEPSRAVIAAVGRRLDSAAPVRRADGGGGRLDDSARRRVAGVDRGDDEPRRESDSGAGEDDEMREPDDDSGPGSGDDDLYDDDPDSSGPGSGDYDDHDDYVAPVVADERDNSGPGSYSSGGGNDSDLEPDDSVEDRSGSNRGPG